MSKAANLTRKRFPDLHGRPLVHYYQRVMENTQSVMLQELLRSMFETNQWELPEKFQKQKVSHWTDDI